MYRPAEFEDKSHVEIPLWKKTLGWGPAKDNVEDTCHFKLLVTTEPLDHQQFLQSGQSQSLASSVEERAIGLGRKCKCT